MELQPLELNAFHGDGSGDSFIEPAERDAEFVFGKTGRYVVVGVGVDVGIDAQGNRRHATFFAGDGIDYFKLLDRFHVETSDPGVKRQSDLKVGFAHTAICDVGGGDSGFESPRDLPTADAVGS